MLLSSAHTENREDGFGSFLKSKGDLSVKVIRAKVNHMPFSWRLKQFIRLLSGWLQRAEALAFSKITGVSVLLGNLSGTLVRANGERVSLGVLGYKMVTTAFCTDLCSALVSNDANFVNFKYHDAGTGTNAEAIGDTTLQTAWGGSRVSGTASNPTAVQYRQVATITFNNSFAITEHGLFKASSSGTLMDRTVFAAVNVVNGDSIQFTYTFTATAGG